jgi:hypothetical protein
MAAAIRRHPDAAAVIRGQTRALTIAGWICHAARMKTSTCPSARALAAPGVAALLAFTTLLSPACTGTIVDHRGSAVGDDADDDGDDTSLADAPLGTPETPDAAPGTPDAAPGIPDAAAPIADGAVVPPEPDAAPGPAHDVQPHLIAGGGVAHAPVGGELYVYVGEARTGAPVAGASVRLGDAAASSVLSGTTDASGLVVLTSATLAGAQTVTASATGHAAATWIGVRGANVTLPLAPTAAPPSATVSGSITGWSSLPAPASFNDYNLAIVLYSFLDDLNAPENSIKQPVANNTPTNSCIRTIISDSCAWKMNTRTGAQLHYAVIVRGNTRGTTNDTSDDTFSLLGYAVGSAVTMTAGQTMNGEALSMVSAGSLTGLQVSFASAPSGLGDVVAIPMLDLAGVGRVVIPLPQVTPAAASAMLPSGGVLAGAVTQVLGSATPPGAANAPFSIGFARSSSGGAASTGAFPAPPTGLSAGGNHYGFTGVAGASLHTLDLNAPAASGGALYWSVVVLDDTRSFNLPALAVDPLPAGTLELHVSGKQVDGFDSAAFDMPRVTSTFTHAAGDQVTFQH